MKRYIGLHVMVYWSSCKSILVFM